MNKTEQIVLTDIPQQYISELCDLFNQWNFDEADAERHFTKTQFLIYLLLHSGF